MKTYRVKSLAVLLAVMLLVLGTIGTAYAYFSDYDWGAGTAKLSLSGSTTIDEEVKDGVKNIVIENKSEQAAVIVRVGIYGPDEMKVTLPPNDNWEKSGDFWYYKKVLAAGETTVDPIKAEISGMDEKDFEEYGDSLNITVVHESAVVVYNEDGSIRTPEGWDAAIVSKIEG